MEKSQVEPRLKGALHHSDQWNTPSGKVLPEETLGKSRKGFKRAGEKVVVPYDDIWEHDVFRDEAHKRHNRHFPRKVDDITLQDTSLEKDMLIYVVLLIFLIIPYTGMVLCRKFCPHVLHGGTTAAEAQAAKREKEQLKKELAAKHAEDEDDDGIGIVEIDLAKKKKDREGKLGTDSLGVHRLSSPDLLSREHRQEQIKRFNHKNETSLVNDENREFVKNIRKRGRIKRFKSNYYVLPRRRNNRITPDTGNIYNQSAQGRLNGFGDSAAKKSRSISSINFKSRKVSKQSSDADDEDDEYFRFHCGITNHLGRKGTTIQNLNTVLDIE